MLNYFAWVAQPQKETSSTENLPCLIELSHNVEYTQKKVGEGIE